MPDPHRWRMLLWICVAELGALSRWFSATAVIPALRTSWMSPSSQAWLSMAVTLGLVAGTNGPHGRSYRRTATTMLAMLGSGACAAGIGLAFDHPLLFVPARLPAVRSPGAQVRARTLPALRRRDGRGVLV
jgi:hypothetical protein